MLETPVFKLLASLAVPTVCSQLVTVLYNTADTWFVSQISTTASAAVGVVFALMSIIQACGYGFGMGCGSLISRSLGAGRNEEANRYASSAFFGTILIGALIGLFGLIFLKPLMRLLGSTETILPYACDYAFYILLAAPLMCAAFVLNNILRAQGAARFAMIGLCTGGFLNIFLDWLLIFKLDLGISGAAIATALSQVVSFCLLLSAFIRKISIVEMKPRYISVKLSTYGKIVSTGLPTVCRQGLGSVASALLNIFASGYGDAAVAAMAIVNKLYSLVRSVIVGLGQGFQPIAGYNFSAGRMKRVRESVVDTIIVGTIICTVTASLSALFAVPIITWFRDDEEVIKIGTAALYFCCLVLPTMGYSTVVNQMYQCLGFRVKATFLASCRQGILFIPLLLILNALLHLTGVEMAQPAADAATFLVSIPFQIAFFKNELPLSGASEKQC